MGAPTDARARELEHIGDRWFTFTPFGSLGDVARCWQCGCESPAGIDMPRWWARDHVCPIVAYGRSLDAAANRATRAGT